LQLCDLAAHLTAASVRCVDASLAAEDRVQAYARAPSSRLWATPWTTWRPAGLAYGSGGKRRRAGQPVDRPGEPVLCLQEARTHARGAHRGSRPVTGGWRQPVAAAVRAAASTTHVAGGHEALPPSRPEGPPPLPPPPFHALARTHTHS
jgi:hypothetical protein